MAFWRRKKDTFVTLGLNEPTETRAAQLKKAYALLNLNQRDAGVRELRALIARYPKSLEAQQARDRLRSLGATSTASKPSPTRQR